MSAPVILAIDLGTGGPKVAVVDASGVVLGSGIEPVTTTFTADGGAEQDPRQWWTAIVAAARQALAKSGAGGRIAAVCCTSQYSSTVAVDKDGEPTAPCIMWMDSRGSRYNKHLVQSEHLRDYIIIHGFIPTSSGADGLSHMLYIKHGLPDAYARTAAFLEPLDYVNLKLTGRVAATQSTVFPMLMCDNREHGATSYSAELVELGGIDPAKLPPLVPMDGIVGPLSNAAATELGIAAGVPVFAGASDSITAAIAGGAVDCRNAAIVIGTTSVLVTHVDRKDTDLMHAILSVPSPVDGRYFVMAENGVGGRALELFLRSLVFADDALGIGPAPADVFERAATVAATSPVGSNGVMFMPWLAGSIAPSADDNVRGGFLGIGLTTTRADMTRAVFEGVALNLRWLLPHVEEFAQSKFPFVRFAGGGATSDLWSQILANVLGIPVHQLEDPRNTNARGAAFLALQRLGVFGFDDIAGRLRVRRVWEPEAAATEIYAKLGERFVSAHGMLSNWYAAG